MKKLIALLLVLCTVFSLCACGSSSKKKTIDEITDEDLNAAAEKLMEAESEEEASVDTTEDNPPIEDYLVTVELTPENFDEYFEFETVPALDEWGEPVSKYLDNWNITSYTNRLFIKSKKYEDGLIIYDIQDSLFEYEFWGDKTCNQGFQYDKISSSSSSLDLALTGMTNVFVANPITSPDQYEVKLGRCKGTVTYIKEEYIVETTKEKSMDDLGYPVFWYNYDLADGSTFGHAVFSENEY